MIPSHETILSMIIELLDDPKTDNRGQLEAWLSKNIFTLNEIMQIKKMYHEQFEKGGSNVT